MGKICRQSISGIQNGINKCKDNHHSQLTDLRSLITTLGTLEVPRKLPLLGTTLSLQLMITTEPRCTVFLIQSTYRVRSLQCLANAVSTINVAHLLSKRPIYISIELSLDWESSTEDDKKEKKEDGQSSFPIKCLFSRYFKT